MSNQPAIEIKFESLLWQSSSEKLGSYLKDDYITSLLPWSGERFILTGIWHLLWIWLCFSCQLFLSQYYHVKALHKSYILCLTLRYLFWGQKKYNNGHMAKGTFGSTVYCITRNSKLKKIMECPIKNSAKFCKTKIQSTWNSEHMIQYRDYVL